MLQDVHSVEIAGIHDIRQFRAEAFSLKSRHGEQSIPVVVPKKKAFDALCYQPEMLLLHVFVKVVFEVGHSSPCVTSFFEAVEVGNAFPEEMHVSVVFVPVG